MISPVNCCFARFVMFDDKGMMISASCVKNAMFNTGISAKLTNLGCHRYESFPFIQNIHVLYISPSNDVHMSDAVVHCYVCQTERFTFDWNT